MDDLNLDFLRNDPTASDHGDTDDAFLKVCASSSAWLEPVDDLRASFVADTRLAPSNMVMNTAAMPIPQTNALRRPVQVTPLNLDVPSGENDSTTSSTSSLLSSPPSPTSSGSQSPDWESVKEHAAETMDVNRIDVWILQLLFSGRPEHEIEAMVRQSNNSYLINRFYELQNYHHQRQRERSMQAPTSPSLHISNRPIVHIHAKPSFKDTAAANNTTKAPKARRMRAPPTAPSTKPVKQELKTSKAKSKTVTPPSAGSMGLGYATAPSLSPAQTTNAKRSPNAAHVKKEHHNIKMEPRAHTATASATARLAMHQRQRSFKLDVSEILDMGSMGDDGSNDGGRKRSCTDPMAARVEQQMASTSEDGNNNNSFTTPPPPRGTGHNGGPLISPITTYYPKARQSPRPSPLAPGFNKKTIKRSPNSSEAAHRRRLSASCGSLGTSQLQRTHSARGFTSFAPSQPDQFAAVAASASASIDAPQSPSLQLGPQMFAMNLSTAAGSKQVRRPSMDVHATSILDMASPDFSAIDFSNLPGPEDQLEIEEFRL